MIDFYNNFINLNRSIKDNQKLINLDGVVKVYYGVNSEGLYRLAFLSSTSSNIRTSTKNIQVVAGPSKNNYWTCFDLKVDHLLPVFSIFCEDLAMCVISEKNENVALSNLKSRFNTWLALFKKTRLSLSIDKAKGLFGELYFLNSYLIDKYGVFDAIKAWSGPENYNKDFSIDSTWYELKTISSNSPIVKISSIQQLDSDKTGYLVIIKTEEMSESYKSDNSNINKLCQSIISKISDPDLKDVFLKKVSDAGYDFSDDLGNKNYSVKAEELYKVSDDFPVMKLADINSDAINNVSYELILKFIEKYKEFVIK